MVVMAPRESWTDERLDEGFREVRAEIGQLRVEIGQVRESLGELRAELKGLEKKFDAKFEAQQNHMDARFDDLSRTMRIGFGQVGGALAVIGAVLAGILGLIATQL